MQRSGTIETGEYTFIGIILVLFSGFIVFGIISLAVMVLYPADTYVRTDQEVIILTGIQKNKVSIWVSGHSFQEFSLGKYCNPRGPKGRRWIGPVDIMKTHQGKVYAQVNVAGLRREICS